ncbi:hypothetical protein ES319_D07G067400v1 [Gossypium barbadense]|uniref:Glycosyltransferase family 28 N-terminal domain-containing protein n=1 Tax=Gossypium barbadense TaxID=3634 RepID=A0A5J5QMU0_GOSBA|nr:hypothetical protein ES319_D07G067400v1 [Gossypium barbadense]
MASTTQFLISLPPKPPYLLSYSSPSKPRFINITCCLSIQQARNDQTTSSGSNALNGLRVAFAAGGTGGHIYPAVAIADELKLVNPTSEILFLGRPNSMESTAIPSAHFEFKSIPAVKLVRPFFSLRNLLLPYFLIKSITKCFTLLSKFEPHLVVGTGGFPRKEKCVVCGNPVRLSLKNSVSKAVSRLHFFPWLEKMEGSSEEIKVILVLGGSLGANAVNIALLNVYSQLLLEHENWFIIWQTGVESFNEMESLVRSHPRLLLAPFLHSMNMAYAAADLVVSRAGAMTCSEILATGKPSILVD